MRPGEGDGFHQIHRACMSCRSACDPASPSTPVNWPDSIGAVSLWEEEDIPGFGENVSSLARAPLAAATLSDSWGPDHSSLPHPPALLLRKAFHTCHFWHLYSRKHLILSDSAPRWKLDIYFNTGKTKWKACNRKKAIYTFYHRLTFEAWTFWQPSLRSLLLLLFWSNVEAFPLSRLPSLPSACPLHPRLACLSGNTIGVLKPLLS